MKKNNRGKDVAEKQLFHGTDRKHVDAICKNNFDWRICGTHGTAYGKGEVWKPGLWTSVKCMWTLSSSEAVFKDLVCPKIIIYSPSFHVWEHSLLAG